MLKKNEEGILATKSGFQGNYGHIFFALPALMINGISTCFVVVASTLDGLRVQHAGLTLSHSLSVTTRVPQFCLIFSEMCARVQQDLDSLQGRDGNQPAEPATRRAEKQKNKLE